MSDIRDLAGEGTSVVLRLSKDTNDKYRVHAELYDGEALVDRVEVTSGRALPFAMEQTVNAILSLELMINRSKVKLVAS